MVRLILLLLAIIPGSSPILLGREVRGSLLLFAGLNAWNLSFVGFFLWINDDWATPLGWCGLLLGCLATAVSVTWTLRLTSPARRRRIREATDRALRAALRSWLRGKPGEARVAVDSGLRVWGDDPDLLFLSWYLMFHARGPRRAYPRLRRLRHADREEKWLWEIRREEELHARRS